MNITEIKKMSTIERLQSMEALWDSLLEDESEIESPKWHGEVLEERKKQMESGRTEFMTLEALKSSNLPAGASAVLVSSITSGGYI